MQADQKFFSFNALNGRSSKIRTYDPHVPNVALYQAELYSDASGRI